MEEQAPSSPSPAADVSLSAFTTQCITWELSHKEAPAVFSIFHSWPPVYCRLETHNCAVWSDGEVLCLQSTELSA